MVKLRIMSPKEFGHYSRFSFENFVSESAKSTKQEVETLRANLGGPPKRMLENDIWFVVNYANQGIGYIWIKLFPENKKRLLGMIFF
jgi:hypothetical protein